MSLSKEEKDILYMRKALNEAHRALEDNEIPVGAVVVCEDQVIGKGYNQTERLNDVTAHAEMLATTAAANYLGAKYLNTCTLYITLEPCLMCTGAIAWAQYGRVVWGAEDKRRKIDLQGIKAFHPKTQITEGILADECSELLLSFFEKKRRL